MRHLNEAELAVLAMPRRDSEVVATAFGDSPARRIDRKGDAVARDCHSYREVMMVLSGTAEIALQERCYRLEAGDVALFDAGEWHDRGYPAGAPEGLHLWFFPLPGAFSGGLVTVDARQWNMESRLWCRDEALMQVFHRAWAECFARPTPLNRQYWLSCFHLLTLEAMRQLTATERPNMVEPVRTRQQEAIDAVKKHLHQNLGARDTIDGLARLAGFSRAHFMRLFAQYTGCTVLEYINRLRRAALADLEHSGLLQKEIADRLGFASTASLLHWRGKQKEQG